MNTLNKKTPGFLASALALVLAFGVSAVFATDAAAELRSDFWDELANPGHKRYQAELARGRKLQRQARRMRSSRLRLPHLVQRVYADALAAYRRASKARPKAAEAKQRAAQVLFRLERYKEAMRAVLEARQLDARVREDTDLAFDMGIAYSKLGKFQRAINEYDLYERVQARKSPGKRYGRGVAHANAAESLMALGRLDEAIQRYRASGRLAGTPLTFFGLAVALDRDEQVSKAMDAVKRGLRSRLGIRALTTASVFFVPRGDIHYYFGLAHLASGKLKQAQESFSRFLAALPKSPWAFRARAHLVELGNAPIRNNGGKKRKGGTRRKRRLAPLPGPFAARGDRLARDRRNYRRSMRSAYYSLRRCYKRSLRRSRKLAGAIKVRLVVGTNGRVSKAKIVYSNLRQPKLHKCVLKTLKNRYFGKPSSGKPVKLVVPIEFRAR